MCISCTTSVHACAHEWLNDNYRARHCGARWTMHCLCPSCPIYIYISSTYLPSPLLQYYILYYHTWSLVYTPFTASASLTHPPVHGDPTPAPVHGDPAPCTCAWWPRPLHLCMVTPPPAPVHGDSTAQLPKCPLSPEGPQAGTHVHSLFVLGTTSGWGLTPSHTHNKCVHARCQVSLSPPPSYTLGEGEGGTPYTQPNYSPYLHISKTHQTSPLTTPPHWPHLHILPLTTPPTKHTSLLTTHHAPLTPPHWWVGASGSSSKNCQGHRRTSFNYCTH